MGLGNKFLGWIESKRYTNYFTKGAVLRTQEKMQKGKKYASEKVGKVKNKVESAMDSRSAVNGTPKDLIESEKVKKMIQDISVFDRADDVYLYLYSSQDFNIAVQKHLVQQASLYPGVQPVSYEDFWNNLIQALLNVKQGYKPNLHPTVSSIGFGIEENLNRISRICLKDRVDYTEDGQIFSGDRGDRLTKKLKGFKSVNELIRILENPGNKQTLGLYFHTPGDSDDLLRVLLSIRQQVGPSSIYDALPTVFGIRDKVKEFSKSSLEKYRNEKKTEYESRRAELLNQLGNCNSPRDLLILYKAVQELLFNYVKLGVIPKAETIFNKVPDGNIEKDTFEEVFGKLGTPEYEGIKFSKLLNDYFAAVKVIHLSGGATVEDIKFIFKTHFSSDGEDLINSVVNFTARTMTGLVRQNMKDPVLKDHYLEINSYAGTDVSYLENDVKYKFSAKITSQKDNKVISYGFGNNEIQAKMDAEFRILASRKITKTMVVGY